MSSELRVDKIIPTSGVPTGGGGGIIQVKYTFRPHTLGQLSTNSTTYTDAGTSLDVLITPHFNTSKILLKTNLQIYTDNTNTHSYLAFVRDDNIGTGSHGSNNALYHTSAHWHSEGGARATNISMEFLDSPATTNQVKYSIYWKVDNSSSTAYINGSSNSDGFISAMEVSA